MGERSTGEGHVAASELFDFAQRLGFEPSQIGAALEYATDKRLLDAAPRNSGTSESLYFRITTVGAYTTRVLLAYFAYMDAVVVDTPIIDQVYRNIIHDAHPLPDRLNRAEFFRVYLDNQWAKMVSDDLPWLWSETSSKLREDIRKIGRIADPGTWSWDEQ